MRLLVLNLRLGQKNQALAVTALLLPTCERKTTNTLHSNKIQTRIQTITTETMKATLILLAIAGLIYGSHQPRTIQVCNFHLPAAHCKPTSCGGDASKGNVNLDKAPGFPAGWTCYKCRGATYSIEHGHMIIQSHNYIGSDGSMHDCGMTKFVHRLGDEIIIRDYYHKIIVFIETDVSSRYISASPPTDSSQGWNLQDTLIHTV